MSAVRFPCLFYQDVVIVLAGLVLIVRACPKECVDVCLQLGCVCMCMSSSLAAQGDDGRIDGGGAIWGCSLRK